MEDLKDIQHAGGGSDEAVELLGSRGLIVWLNEIRVFALCVRAGWFCFFGLNVLRWRPRAACQPGAAALTNACS